ncbi:Ribosomal protein L37ae [Penicillium occitanis (nom. inval.)]|nr:Ribosomal protein L37ae [Penicillium occitanis (nom. inval.)]PCG97069.1 hypothetical protein PENOC_069750 [Penicillium occitanis (nom. inval.)]
MCRQVGVDAESGEMGRIAREEGTFAKFEAIHTHRQVSATNNLSLADIKFTEVGITGKYGVRYGASLRKQLKRLEVTQHARYTCTFCGRNTVRRHSVGIWNCSGCKKTMTGGAYTLSTPAASAARSTLRRLREINE